MIDKPRHIPYEEEAQLMLDVVNFFIKKLPHALEETAQHFDEAAMANTLVNRLSQAPELLVSFAIGWAALLAAVGHYLGFGKELGGLLAGVVTNINDPEKLGRVKVKIPTLGDEVETRWARVASPGGGPSRGLELLPEVNDEVLVGFEFGDMQRPVVLGGLWNSKDALPEAAAVADGKVKKRTWKSRLGHTIEMTDDDSAPTLIITHSGKSTKIELTKDALNITTDKALTVKGKDVTVQATGDLTLKGQKVEVNASAGMTLKAGADMTIKGTQIKLN